MSAPSTTSGQDARFPQFGEFVALIGLMMAIVALSIDNLLPAFVPIHNEFALPGENDVQFIISSYMIGFAVSQMIYGPLSDAIGRRPSMLIGMMIYTVGTVLAIVATSFEALLVARAVQGIGAAAARVLVMTIVRDRYQGEEMARVMSFVMMVFIIAPIIAPASGALILTLGSWRYIFLGMLVMAAGLVLWFWLRMPETLHPAYRRRLSPSAVLDGVRTCLSNRTSLGYTLAISLMMGTLMGYLNSAQQVFETEVYALGVWFPLVFGIVAGVMGIAAFVNARLVRQLGMRRMSHIGVTAYCIFGLMQVGLALAYGGHPPLVPFCALLAANQFIFSLTVPNFNALAMGPMGRIAGTASSFIGAFTTMVSTVIGVVIGQAFNGTVLPMSCGYLILGVLSALVVFWTERGKMFTGPQAP